jgi:hypothetical protein
MQAYDFGAAVVEHVVIVKLMMGAVSCAAL